MWCLGVMCVVFRGDVFRGVVFRVMCVVFRGDVCGV